MASSILQPLDIRALRKSLGLTQAALGDRLGVTNVTVSRWEAGALAPDHRATVALKALAGVTVAAPDEEPVSSPALKFTINSDAVAAAAETARLSFGDLASQTTATGVVVATVCSNAKRDARVPDEAAGAQLDVPEVEATGLFDGAYYLDAYADVAALGEDAAVRHFCQHGWRELRKPNRYFDVAWYVQQMPAAERGEMNPLLHYAWVGERRGLRPTLFFDPAWYRSQYGLSTDESPLRHYLTHARSGEFSPIPELSSDNGRVFDPESEADQITLLRRMNLVDKDYYIGSSLHVLAQGIDPSEHFFRFGQPQNRDPSYYFNTNWYLSNNPEAATVQPLLHYALVGEKAGRHPSRLFDPGWYRRAYNLAPEEGALAHYIHHSTTGRFSPLPEFDVAFYILTNPDVAAAKVDPFRHFLVHGYGEGRKPSANFDAKFYIDHYLHGDHTQNAFLHYLEHKEELVVPNLPSRSPLVPPSAGNLWGRTDQTITETAAHASNFVSQLVDDRSQHALPSFDAKFSDVSFNEDTRGLPPSVAEPGPGSFPLPRSVQLQQISSSGLFDMEYYVSRYPDIAQSSVDPLEHFFDIGYLEGRWPNPYFDPVWYLEQDEGLRASKEQPLFHYFVTGDREGRRPSPLFDTAWYRSTYNIAADELALAHYLSQRKSGRFSPIPEFDVRYYGAKYPDIAATGVDLFEHFFSYGWREGRNPSKDFDIDFYARRYLRGDLSENPFSHYIAHRHEPGVYGRMPEEEATIPREIRRFTNPSNDFEEYRPLPASAPRRAKVLAYYLPQFHAFPENDNWWGKGFTEWTNISRGIPRFKGHYQPRVPRDLGFYSLEDENSFRRQAEMAHASGIFGFVLYYYWFDGKRLMQKPVERFLSDPSIAMPFCLMWANENWTRRWDGAEADVLIAQNYRADDDERIVADFARHFADPRYIRLQGRPLLMIYRMAVIPDAAKKLERWRRIFLDRFGEEPLFVMAQSFDDTDPRAYGLDGAIEFPPHKLTHRICRINSELQLLDEEFKGNAYSYDDVVRVSLDEPPPPYPLIKTAFPSWDNDARQQGTGVVITGSTPAKYEDWLSGLLQGAQKHPFFGESLICVNAWNEWCEGAYLEPDLHFGAAYLNATARAVSGISRRTKVPKLVLIGHDAFPSGAQLLLLNIGRTLRRCFGVEIEFLLLDGGKLEGAYEEVASLTVVANDPAAELRLKALVGQGFAHAIISTTAAARITNAVRAAGLEPVVLVHELPRNVRETQLGAGLAAAVSAARHVVVASPFVRDQVLLEAGSPISDRITILPQGIYQELTPHLGAAEAIREEFGILADDSFILGAGYADLRKGFDLFLHLWRQLQAAPVRGRVHLVWAGGIDPGLQNWLATEIADATATGTFHMAGYRSDMAAVFSAADGFALTSREDPFPSVALEALSMGMPVFAFDRSGGIPDVLRQEQGNGVVPYGDVVAMAGAIVAALSDGMTNAQREARRVKFTSRFAFKPYVRKLLDLAIPGLPAVSVVVPNYNYARYIPDRLASIFHQSHPVYEVIVLDDGSSDDSLRLIPEVADEWQREIRLVANERNSGSVFAQWRKAAELATGEFVWIAEADDLSERDFLARTLPTMAADPSVQLAFTDSRTINSDGSPQWATYRPYYATVAPDALAQSEVFDGASFVLQFQSVKNLILNVSAVVWRRDALLRCLDACRDDLATLRMAGDWRLYLEALSLPGARIAYEAQPLNVHRRHTQSVTHTVAAERHVDEIARCHAFVRAVFELPEQAYEAQDAYIAEVRKQLGVFETVKRVARPQAVVKNTPPRTVKPRKGRPLAVQEKSKRKKNNGMAARNKAGKLRHG